MTEAQAWGATEAEYAAAQNAVDKALQSATHLLSDAESTLLREDLLAYLFGTPAGRFALRQVLERPAPDRSGDILKGDGQPADAKRKAGGETK